MHFLSSTDNVRPDGGGGGERETRTKLFERETAIILQNVYIHHNDIIHVIVQVYDDGSYILPKWYEFCGLRTRLFVGRRVIYNLMFCFLNMVVVRSSAVVKVCVYYTDIYGYFDAVKIKSVARGDRDFGKLYISPAVKNTKRAVFGR